MHGSWQRQTDQGSVQGVKPVVAEDKKLHITITAATWAKRRRVRENKDYWYTKGQGKERESRQMMQNIKHTKWQRHRGRLRLPGYSTSMGTDLQCTVQLTNPPPMVNPVLEVDRGYEVGKRVKRGDGYKREMDSFTTDLFAHFTLVNCTRKTQRVEERDLVCMCVCVQNTQGQHTTNFSTKITKSREREIHPVIA